MTTATRGQRRQRPAERLAPRCGGEQRDVSLCRAIGKTPNCGAGVIPVKHKPKGLEQAHDYFGIVLASRSRHVFGKEILSLMCGGSPTAAVSFNADGDEGKTLRLASRFGAHVRQLNVLLGQHGRSAVRGGSSHDTVAKPASNGEIQACGTPPAPSREVDIHVGTVFLS